MNLYSPYLTIHCSSSLLAESPLNHKSLHHQTYSVGRWFLLSYHQVYLQGLQAIWFPLHTSISTKKTFSLKGARKSFFRSLWFSLGCVWRGGWWNRLHCKNIISFTITSRENWLFLLQAAIRKLMRKVKYFTRVLKSCSNFQVVHPSTLSQVGFFRIYSISSSPSWNNVAMSTDQPENLLRFTNRFPALCRGCDLLWLRFKEKSCEISTKSVRLTMSGRTKKKKQFPTNMDHVLILRHTNIKVLLPQNKGSFPPDPSLGL